MVKESVLPASGIMALGAILPKLSLVYVIPSMAGEAILRSRTQIQQGGSLRMARLTVKGRMFALQRESQQAVVKGVAVTVYPIMTGQAIRSEGFQVFPGKGSIQITVTLQTRGLVKLAETGGMAIQTGKGSSARFFPMSL